jgi:hypothetical protein
MTDGNLAFNFSESQGDGTKRTAMVPVSYAEFLVLRQVVQYLIPKLLGLS